MHSWHQSRSLSLFSVGGVLSWCVRVRRSRGERERERVSTERRKGERRHVRNHGAGAVSKLARYGRLGSARVVIRAPGFAFLAAASGGVASPCGSVWLDGAYGLMHAVGAVGDDGLGVGTWGP